MTWEFVAQIAALVLLALLSALILTGIVLATKTAKTKRDIQLYEAGLMPKGWKKP